MNPSVTNALRWGVPIFTALSATVIGVTLGFELALLLLAAAAFVLVIWLMWSSIQSLTGDAALSFEEALSLGAPSAEEEQKRAVLRALKDLEFEKSIGKISNEDYAEYSARYREQAKRLMQSLDETLGAERARVEKLVQERLQKAGLREAAAAEAKESAERAADTLRPKKTDDDEDAAPASSKDEQPKASSGSKAEPKAATSVAAPATESAAKVEAKKRECESCQAVNELDARFCKRCGGAMAKAGEHLCGQCPARYAEDLTTCPDCGASAEAV
jgi:hypothetical protein